MLSWISEPRAWQNSHLTLRLRLRAEVAIEEVPGGALGVAHAWGVLRIAGVSPAVASTLKRLTREWLTSEELLSIAAGEERLATGLQESATGVHESASGVQESATDVQESATGLQESATGLQESASGVPEGVAATAVLFAQHLWALDQIGSLLRVQVARGEVPLLTVEPLSCSSDLAFPPSQCAAPHLSRFAYLRRHDGNAVLESGVASHRVVLHDASSLSLVHALMHEDGQTGDVAAEVARVAPPHLHPASALLRRDETFDEGAMAAAIDLFDAAGMLDGRERAPAAAIGEELLRMGEFHDLLFHRRSRFGRHDEPFGAEFPYRETIASPPPIPTPRDGPVISLPSPSAVDVRARDLTLSDALEQRISQRDYASQPLTLHQIGEFLFRCARVRGLYGPAPEAGMPYEAVDKPLPAGGGMHELELYLIVHRVEGLPEGAYHYAAHRHALESISARPAALALLLQSAMRASAAPEPPHVLFKIASRFARMSWKYRSISYATTLKNVGVLYQTMYLVATSMRLAACALGSGDDVAAEQALSLAARSEIAVGEFMLGTAESAAGRSLRAQATWRPRVGSQWGRD